VIFLKIALVCTEKLPVPPIAGGAVQLYIDGIAPFLAAKHDITIFSIQYPGLPDRETVNGIKLVRLHGGNNANYLNSLKAALDSSFDLIHVQPAKVYRGTDAYTAEVQIQSEPSQ
jgi:spore coat protein SA